MQSPDAARQHLRGTFFAVALLFLTITLAVVIGAVLVLGVGADPSDGAIQTVARSSVPPGKSPTPTTATPATTSAPTTTTTEAPTTTAALCIGDSVMLAASPQYYDTLAMCGTVDATVSRAWSSAASTVQGRSLPDRVVLHLGTNGYTDAGEIDAVLSQLQDVKRVVLVNVQLNGTRRWEGSVNGEISAAAARWPNVRLADWKAASDGHREYFRGDNIHPSQAGALAYAGVIAAAL
ncbi:MAG TPA: hypothetical protein VK611_21990 [Acidimicrobiales bacterium]|nr:hypothetical protein [Acidimicrobiales bacterium]